MLNEDKKIILNTVILSLEAQKLISEYRVARKHLSEADIIWDIIKKSWSQGGHLPIIYRMEELKRELSVYIYLENLNSKDLYQSKYDVVI